MGHRGSGRYARGDNAVAICERCSKKTLRRFLVYDGQYPDLLVCKECWDPKHPQEYLPDVTDPVTIYDPTGDPDKGQANVAVVSWPPSSSFLDVSPSAQPLQIGVSVNATKFNLINASLDPTSPGLGEIPGPQLVGDAGGQIVSGAPGTATSRPPLPGAGADPDSMGSIEEGHLILIIAAMKDISSNGHHSIDSGYKILYSNRGSSTNGTLTIFWKIATATETAPTITWYDPNAAGNHAQAIAYSNVDQSDWLAGIIEVQEQKQSDTNPQATELSWISGKLQLNPGDKALSVYYDPNDALTGFSHPTPTTALMDETSPGIQVGHWDPAENPEVDNLLGTSEYDDAVTGFSVQPVGASITDYDEQGAHAKILSYNPTSEATWWEKDFAVESGKSYWIGAITGLHVGSGQPDYCALAVDDGSSEDGIIYRSADGNAAQPPEFGNDIGAGPDLEFTQHFGNRGTLTAIKWTSTVTGNVTFKLYLTHSSSSLLHSIDMTSLRGIPVMAVWACEANSNNPNMPVFPPFVQSSARQNVMNALHYSATSRNFGIGNRQINVLIGIRGDGSAVNNADLFRFPAFNAQWQDATNNDATVLEGPSAATLSTSANNKIYSTKPRPADSGKFYFEFELVNPQNTPAGIANIGAGLHFIGGPPNSFVGAGNGTIQWDNGIGVEADGNTVYQHGTVRGAVGWGSLVAGDVISFAVDFDTDSIEYRINNVLQGDLMTEGGTITFNDDVMLAPACNIGTNNVAARWRPKMKSSEFVYTPPTGFSAWSDE